MPKKYLRVSALILPHEREAYAAYRMQPKRESCAALYQALRENMATLEQAAKIPNFRRKKGQAGIAVRLYLELLDEYRDVLNYVFLERCKVCVAELIKEAALFGTVSWTEAKAQAWLAQIDMRPFISPCLGKPRPDALFQDKNLVTLASIMKEDLTPAVQGVPFYYNSMRYDWFAIPLSAYPHHFQQMDAFQLLERFHLRYGPAPLKATE